MIVWRVSYFDEEMGICYAWSTTRRSAAPLAVAIKKHYRKLGGYVPEVWPAVRIHIPTGRGNRGVMVAWLNQHLNRAPAPPRATDPAIGDGEWQTTRPLGPGIRNGQRQSTTAEPGHTEG